MTTSSPQKLLTTRISDFLMQKSLSHNSKQAYTYDLKQFVASLSGPIDATSLKQYDNNLKDLKPSVQKRKRSAVNQFLAFLYQEGALETFLKLEEKKLPQAQTQGPTALDLASLYQGQEGPGKLACLLILELGLLPVEILQLSWSDLDLDFGIVTIAKGQTRRVLKLTKPLKALLQNRNQDGEGLVFDRQGQPYSRQWLYKQLQAYVTTCGYPEASAQVLRQQFIIREIKKGTGAFELARLLGLKSPVTLEKYYRT